MKNRRGYTDARGSSFVVVPRLRLGVERARVQAEERAAAGAGSGARDRAVGARLQAVSRRRLRDSAQRAGARRCGGAAQPRHRRAPALDRKSTRLNSSHQIISYAVFFLKKKK